MLFEFWQNFTHNLFKPLLLFFYFGFLIPILKVRVEFPHVIYQALTMYLLLAIGWHGGEELAEINPSSVGRIAGFMSVGFALNFLIGIAAYFLLNHMTVVRRIDRATVAGYYGSDSAGTFATCVAVLTGAVIVGFISGLQGQKVIHDNDTFFVSAFQGVLCLFLLEMGMTASRKLKDLRSVGFGFIFFGLLTPNIFATLGIIVAHSYGYLIHTEFKPGTYVLFAVLCGAASYIAVPAVQRLAIPEASPSLPLAASLGLTFSYNVTIGIPLYMEIARIVAEHSP